MSRQLKIRVLFVVWIVSVILIGGIFTSYHQPLRTPGDDILTLAPAAAAHQWRAVHFLSGRCGCSQRVMRHLLQRGPVKGISEQLILVDDQEPYLPGTDDLIRALRSEGFPVEKIEARTIPENVGLRGVPLLIVASPAGHVLYTGGYGSHSDQDVAILRTLQDGKTTVPLPLLGCAVGESLKRKVDPFHLKYQLASSRSKN